MVASCSAYGCLARAIKGNGITFHSFPKDKERLKLWLIKVRRKDFKPSSSARICSQHFAPECFDREKFGGTWLKKDAYPTIFVYSQEKPILKSPVRREHIHRPKFIAEPKEPEKRRAHVGDYNEEDMYDPEYAIRFFQKAKETYREQVKKIEQLQAKKESLERKLCSLKQKDKDYEEKNSSQSLNLQEIFRTEPEKGKNYLEDFNEEDMYSPKYAIVFFQMAKEKVTEQRKKIKLLGQKIRRKTKLERKICSLEQKDKAL